MNFLTFLEARTVAFVLAVFDKRSPLKTKIIAALAVLYFLSPFDVLPDFIPLAGWIDDLIVVPLAISSASKYIPREVWDAAMMRAEHITKRVKYILLTGLVIVVLAIGVLVYIIFN